MLYIKPTLQNPGNPFKTVILHIGINNLLKNEALLLMLQQPTLLMLLMNLKTMELKHICFRSYNQQPSAFGFH